MKPSILDNVLLAALVQRIVDSVQPEKIILFGSYATGDADADSDVDLFVQIDTGRSTAEATKQAYAAIRPLRPQLRRGVDIVAKDRAFVERYGDLIGTIVHPVLQEGRVLYAR